MHLSLLVPDILWGRADNPSLFESLDALPGARWLAAQAPTVGGYHATEAILAASCGLSADGGSIDLAALRRRGESASDAETGSGAPKGLLCADPVHFRFHQEFLIAADDTQIGLSEAEADELVSALNASFGEQARFTTAAPGRWYVEFADPLAGSWPPLTEIVGRSLAPRLFEPPALQQFGSEAQMLLHAHPVNTAREASGRPSANGVWLWGQLAATPDTPRTASIPTRLVGSGPLLRGIANAAGVTLATDARLADASGTGDDGAALVFIDSLRAAATYESAEDYLRGWRDFSTAWLEPSIARWRAGRYSSVEILAPCPTYGTLIWRWDRHPGLLRRLRDKLRWQRDDAGLQDLARRLAGEVTP